MAPKIIDEVDGNFFHECPACKTHHYIAVAEPLPNGHRWTFDGNHEKPTFNPSIKINWNPVGREMKICHYFIRSGQIEFCADSTHNLAGKTVPLPPIED